MLARRTIEYFVWQKRPLQFALYSYEYPYTSIYVRNNIRKYSNSFIDISNTVKNALNNGQPVVALETTIVTHGMPYPENYKTACQVEDLIFQQGSVPATIGVIDGRIKVGMDKNSLHRLASLSVSPENKVMKISRRDFPVVLNKSLCGGTTVCGTLLVAKLVGINVFVTGGIGGVHRNVNDSMDISADLIELSRSPIMVVSAGIKSILDIGRTLEYLETVGVCVLSYGEGVVDFPAFYWRKSGYKAAHNVVNAQQAADILLSAKKFALKSGILLGVPIPPEFAMDESEMQTQIEDALKMAKMEGVSGKSLTPFLLGTIGENTRGNSLQANIALIKHNAIVGGQIAFHYYSRTRTRTRIRRVEKKRQYVDCSKRLILVHRGNAFIHAKRNEYEYYAKNRSSSKKIVIVGGSVLDILIFRKNGNTNMENDISENAKQRVFQADISLNAGGVGRNLADAIARLWPENTPYLISAVGDDAGGVLLRNSLQHANSNGLFVCKTKNTASYGVVAEGKCGSSTVFENLEINFTITPEKIYENEQIIGESSLLIFDGNLLPETIDAILQLCDKYKTLVWFEPTDWFVAKKPFTLKSSSSSSSSSTKGIIDFISPNVKELQCIVEHLTGRKYQTTSSNSNLTTILTETRDRALCLLPYVPNIMVTLGKNGVLMITKSYGKLKDDGDGDASTTTTTTSATYYACTKQYNDENVYGAGDCMAAGFIVSMMKGMPEAHSIRIGMNAALQAVLSNESIPRSLRYAECDRPAPSPLPLHLPLTGDINLSESDS